MLGCGSGRTSHHVAQTGNEGDLVARWLQKKKGSPRKGEESGT